MTRAIIFSQGSGSRWGETTVIKLPCIYKQLIPLGKETITSRVIRQLKEAGIDDVWLISTPDLFQGDGVKSYALRDHDVGSIIQGFIKVRHLWKDFDDVLFILGDVIFSNQDFNKLLSTVETHLFGRFGGNPITGKAAKEIFAFRLVGSPEHRSWIYGNLVLLVNQTTFPGKLKLWDWYNTLKGFGNFPEKINFMAVGESYTDDIDSLQEFKQFYPTLLKEVLKDDENKRNT